MSFRELFSPPSASGLPAAPAAIESPCVKICIIEDGLCVGCARTLDEIGAWGSLSPAQRRDIMAALPARRGNPGG